MEKYLSSFHEAYVIQGVSITSFFRKGNWGNRVVIGHSKVTEPENSQGRVGTLICPPPESFPLQTSSIGLSSSAAKQGWNSSWFHACRTSGHCTSMPVLPCLAFTHTWWNWAGLHFSGSNPTTLQEARRFQKAWITLRGLIYGDILTAQNFFQNIWSSGNSPNCQRLDRKFHLPLPGSFVVSSVFPGPYLWVYLLLGLLWQLFTTQRNLRFLVFVFLLIVTTFHDFIDKATSNQWHWSITCSVYPRIEVKGIRVSIFFILEILELLYSTSRLQHTYYTRVPRKLVRP